jgi:DNA-binding CsgD family transcriptional regulator
MVERSTAVRAERALAEVARLAVAGLDGLALLERGAAALKPVAPFDAFCATVTDPATNLIADAVAHRDPGGPPADGRVFATYFADVYFEHDLDLTLAMLRENRSVTRLSDETAGDPVRSGRYRLHLEPRGLGPEVYLTLTDRGLWGEMHLTRAAGSVDFSATELDLLRRAAPLLGAGLRAAGLRATATVTAHAAADVPGVLILDRWGKIASATPNVAAFLTDLGGAPHGGMADDLPVAVRVVLGALERATAAPTGSAARCPRLRVQGRSGRWLTLDASLTEPSAERPSERVVVIGPAPSGDIAQLTVAAHGLSPREEEVVRLVLSGQSTRQIAERLFIAEHTVQRHLGNIFEKVGVHSRRELVKHLFVEQVLPNLN